jgi:hypothetical protein
MTDTAAESGDEARSLPLPDADRGAIQSIERAAMVLALFDQNTRTLSPAVVSERLGLNRTTCSRCRPPAF